MSKGALVFTCGLAAFWSALAGSLVPLLIFRPSVPVACYLAGASLLALGRFAQLFRAVRP